jgi:hypothetical protein
VDRCQEDKKRRVEALRDAGVTQDLGNGMSRRVDFYVGYDHRAFPDDCGGGGHGQHGMEMAFYLIGPVGAVQWKVAMPAWTPRPVGVTGNLEHVAMRGIADIYAVDLGYHWPKPRYDRQEPMECDLLPGGRCFYDGWGSTPVRCSKPSCSTGRTRSGRSWRGTTRRSSMETVADSENYSTRLSKQRKERRMENEWKLRRDLARAVAEEVEQSQDTEMNAVLAAGFVAGALTSARDVNGELMGITVEPVMITGMATSVLRITVPGVLKSEYFLAITQGKELE